MSHTRTTALGWAGRLARAGGVLAALGLLMGVEDNNGCAPTPGGESECSAASDCTGVPDVDCVGDWACQAGECVFECGVAPPTGCYGDQDCGGGQVCNAAEICLAPPGCVPGQPCPAVCYGYCVDPAPSGCYGDQDCKDGERCNASEVCLPPPGCGPGMDCPAVCYGQCVPKLPPGPGCYSDDACGPGTHCSVSDGDCQSPPGCVPGQPCPDVCYGTCVPDAPSVCYGDHDCGPGTHCSVSDGDCDAPPGCNAGMPCPTVCAGICVPDQTGCWSDYDCGPGEQCNTWDHCNVPNCAGGNCLIACQGVCEPKPPSGCQSDSDCKDHEYCGCGPGGGGMPNALWCNLMCMPKPYECQSNADCASGVCNIESCGGAVPPCGADGAGCDDADGAFWPGDCYGYCAPVQPAWDCTSHQDCASGVCDFVVCESGAADPAFAPCDPSGQSCMPPQPPQPGLCYGFCKAPGDDCSSNLDCPGSDVCIGGVCHPVGGECSADSDCGPGHHCQLGPCPLGPCWFDEATGESHCPECFGQCVPNGTTGCQADADCAFGEQCAQECITACPACAPNEPCPPCWSNCFGVCKPANGCGPDGVCPDGTLCQCVGSCPDCDDCAYTVCKEPPPPPPQGCEVDADCQDGYICEHAPCPYFMPCFADQGCYGCGGVCTKPEPPPPSGCMVTGCSGQVCASEPVFTTCEYWPWYACYQYSNCTQLASGACGWEATDAFVQCMLNLGNAGFGATPR